MKSRDIARQVALAGGALGLAWALVACGPPPDEVAQARLAAYFDAVQSEDAERIANLLAACPEGAAAGAEPAACAARIAEQLAAVAAQREAGQYTFDHPWGFGLIRAFVLGRGAYWSVDALDVKGDTAELRLALPTHYRADETEGLPYGAVVEYLGEPLGHVEKVPRGGGGPGTLRTQLEQVMVDARLRRLAGPSGEEAWRVESLTVLPETAVFSQVTWRPR